MGGLESLFTHVCLVGDGLESVCLQLEVSTQQQGSESDVLLVRLLSPLSEITKKIYNLLCTCCSISRSGSVSHVRDPAVLFFIIIYCVRPIMLHIGFTNGAFRKNNDYFIFNCFPVI